FGRPCTRSPTPTCGCPPPGTGGRPPRPSPVPPIPARSPGSPTRAPCPPPDWAGAGLRIPRRFVSSRPLQLAVEHVLGDPGIRARAHGFQDWISVNDPGAVAARLVEELGSGAGLSGSRASSAVSGDWRPPAGAYRLERHGCGHVRAPTSVCADRARCPACRVRDRPASGLGGSSLLLD